MGLKDIVKNTRKLVLKSDIINGLKELGLNQETKVMVHTSLKSFGYIVNRQYDMIDALIETMEDGVIIMPSHNSHSFSDSKGWENPPVPKEWHKVIEENRKYYDPNIFISESVGITPITFLRYKNVTKTDNPSVSLAVYNKSNSKDWFIHSLDEANSSNPMYKLVEEDGYILFLGTDITTCTFLHQCEIFSSKAQKKIFRTKMLKNKKIENVEVNDYEASDDFEIDFKNIYNLFEETYKNTDSLRITKIGDATCTLLKAKDLYEIAKNYYKKL